VTNNMSHSVAVH